jgi:hypothetical protein
MHWNFFIILLLFVVRAIALPILLVPVILVSPVSMVMLLLAHLDYPITVLLTK